MLKDRKRLGLESECTDLSDIGLCSVNTSERHFNILLCYLQLKDVTNAVKMILKLDKSCPLKYQEPVKRLKNIIARW